MRTTRSALIGTPGTRAAAIAAACSFALFGGGDAALAGPEGADVLKGIASISQIGNNWFITANNGSVIQYSSFNIALLETVQFLQPGSNAAVLNLIPFGGPTTIDGTLLANGVVFFANPSGMVFGPNSVVNVGGIYAAAANIDAEQFHQAWMTGKGDLTLTGLEAAGVVTVQPGASIFGASGVHLFGHRVENFGQISTGPGGIISMIANNGNITLAPQGGHYLVQFNNGGPAPGNGVAGEPNGDPKNGNGMIQQVGVHNAGTLSAQDGLIMLGASDLYALAIKLEGNGIAGSTVELHGNVGLAGPSGGEVVISAEDVVFNGKVDALDFDGTDLLATEVGLRIAMLDDLGGNAVFQDAVGSEAPLKSLIVEGQTSLGGGSVTTTGAQEYLGHFALGADTTLEAGSVLFGSSLDGLFDLSVTATEGNVEFHGEVGGADKLTKLEVILASLSDDPQSGAAIVFGTDSVKADELMLNDFTIGHTPFATIVGLGNLTFETGAFTMGQGQKMTILGSLEVDAASGTATLSDINTAGDMTINADSIVLLLRPAGSGFDAGLDFVAGGSFLFSVVPVESGVGPKPQFSNPSADGDANGTLGVYLMRAWGSELNDPTALMIDAEGNILDLAAKGVPLEDISTALARALPDASDEEVEEEVHVDTASRQELERAMTLRDMEPWELRELLQRRGLFDDGGATHVDVPGREPRWSGMALLRANQREARKVIQLHDYLYEKRDAMVDAIGRGWSEYLVESVPPGRTHMAEPRGFIRFLERAAVEAPGRVTFPREDARVARDAMFAMGEYLNLLEALGATPAEVRVRASGTIFEDFRPTAPAVTRDQFSRAVEAARSPRVLR